MLINPQTQLNMVIGYPLLHSKSPLLHHTLYEALKINAVLLACPQQNLGQLVKAIKTLSVALVAVTMPFKEKILPYLDDCSAVVKTIKAANTIIQREEKLYGYNTDVDGIQYALRDTPLRKKNVLLLGAGGAAKAAAFVLQKAKANIFCYNRTKSKATSLMRMFEGIALTEAKLNFVPFDLIINTTPVGMSSADQQSPLTKYCFNSHQTVFDMVYNPIHTPLLMQAKKQGATIISGIEMFIGQGIKQVELWQNEKNILKQPNIINLLQQRMRAK